MVKSQRPDAKTGGEGVVTVVDFLFYFLGRRVCEARAAPSL